MDRETKRLAEIGIAWCGPLFVLGYIVFWAWLGHNVPPPNMMGMTAAQMIADYYGKYQHDIEIGMIVSCFVGLIYTPWSCLLASMLREKDGSLTVFSFMELAGGILTGWVLAFCPAIWTVCALFATSVDPSIIKVLHTLGWVIYDCTFMVTTTQVIGLGLYTVLNKSQTIFPAWAGWCSIAVGIIFLPLLLIPFVSEGPFAVGGSWNFFVVFGTWLFLFFAPYSYFMLRALSQRTEGVSLGAVAQH